MRTKLKIKLGFEKAKSTEFTQSLIFVVNAALGGGKKNRPTQDEFQAAAAFSSMFGNGFVQTTGDEGIFKGLDDAFNSMDNK